MSMKHKGKFFSTEEQKFGKTNSSRDFLSNFSFSRKDDFVETIIFQFGIFLVQKNVIINKNAIRVSCRWSLFQWLMLAPLFAQIN